MTKVNLPVEVLCEVVQYIPCSWDKTSVSKTCRALHRALQPGIYRTIEVKGTKRCYKLVRTLIKCPHLCHFIREMTLRPNYQAMAGSKRLKEETDLAMALELVIPNLHELRRFMWDGVEMLGNNSWRALRLSCPFLKNIGSNIGSRDIDPSSELFEFSDLTAFSLTTENRNAKYRRPFDFIAESLPPALWTMLLKRCPDLQSLTIGHGGSTRHSLRSLDVWPLVHSPANLLHLFPILPNSIEILSDWIDIQPSLKHIHVDSLIDLDHNKGLKSAEVHPLTRRPRKIQEDREEVSFSQAAFPGGWMPLVHMHLARLPNLRKLSLWIDFSSERSTEMRACDAISQLKFMVEACPKLEDLCIRCSTKRKETFTYKAFSEVLRVPGLELKRLELWKRKCKGDSLYAAAAARWAREFLSLDKIVLYRVQDKQEWLGENHRIAIILAGTYQVVRGIDRTALRLSAVERVWPDAWTWSSRFDHRIPPLKAKKGN
ncbi:hypothetical protein Moror_3845 [Moniliophthora roreri MCA 2997]|uniref:F-box domain-containing protein n=1 Tax=Moniliophthora roreri (strain MCA 2997) TaxID=1381753 RepID=V2XNS3_MONRO|nr:hypothetical protein Moror_3845 [Moniliophthora roreri MCA 2997]